MRWRRCQVIKRGNDELVSIDDYGSTVRGHRTPFFITVIFTIGLGEFRLFENFAIRKPTIYWSTDSFIREHCDTVMLFFFHRPHPLPVFFLLCFGTRQVKLVVAFLLYSLLFFRLRVTCSFFSIDRQCFYCHGGCELFLAFEQSKPNHLCKN